MNEAAEGSCISVRYDEPSVFRSQCASALTVVSISLFLLHSLAWGIQGAILGLVKLSVREPFVFSPSRIPILPLGQRLVRLVF
jgi:hypothetical protein